MLALYASDQPRVAVRLDKDRNKGSTNYPIDGANQDFQRAHRHPPRLPTTLRISISLKSGRVTPAPPAQCRRARHKPSLSRAFAFVPQPAKEIRKLDRSIAARIDDERISILVVRIAHRRYLFR